MKPWNQLDMEIYIPGARMKATRITETSRRKKVP